MLLEVPGLDIAVNRSEAALREIWSHRIPGADIIAISAQTGHGIDNLVEKILTFLSNVLFYIIILCFTWELQCVICAVGTQVLRRRNNHG